MSMTGVTPRQPPRLAVLMCFVILATGVNPAVAMGAIGRLPNSCGATAVGCRVRINRSRPPRSANGCGVADLSSEHHPLAGGPED